MAKMLTVRTPVTTDGSTLKYDKNKQPVYKETKVPMSAKGHFERLNAALPEHLRHELVDEDGEQVTEVKSPKASKQPKNAPKAPKAPKVPASSTADEGQGGDGEQQ